MDIILATVMWQFAFIYLAEITIVSKSPLEHSLHVCQALQILSDARVTLRLKKRLFSTDTMGYLGHIIQSG